MNDRSTLVALRPPAGASAQVWASHITTCWRASFEGVLEAGNLLRAAKEALPHGEFEAMVAKDLPFKPSTAQRLMKISADERISNPAHAQLFPPTWTTLYEVTKLDDEQFVKAVNDGTIGPDMERADITQKVKKAKRTERERELGEKQRALPKKKYGVIVADPEWKFEPYSEESGMDRAADNHYPTSTSAVIASRDVGSIAADDCVLFLWATNPMLDQAIEVLKAWGFTYKSNYAWGKDKAGTGYWNREKHELLLIGTHGKPPAPAMGTQRDSFLLAPRGAHSAKPEIFLEMIEQYFPTLPKIELNRRGPARKGWDAWGNESAERIADDSGTNHQPASVPDSVGTDAAIPSTSVSEPASVEQSAPQQTADAGSPLSLPEIILPGMAPTFAEYAAFTDLTPSGVGRAS